VGIYCRISRARRTDGTVEVLGVERQEPPARALVERMGGTVHKVYTDNDLSAYSGKRRPSYEAMLADARAGVITGIAAWHPARHPGGARAGLAGMGHRPAPGGHRGAVVECVIVQPVGRGARSDGTKHLDIRWKA